MLQRRPYEVAMCRCAVCSFHSLQATQATPALPSTHTMARLLVELLPDSKLASPYMHDVVLQSTANLLSSKKCLDVVQNDADLMEKLVPRLMERYDQGRWVALSHVFLQAVGRDAAARRAEPPAPPSKLQQSITRLVLRRTDTAMTFLHEVCPFAASPLLCIHLVWWDFTECKCAGLPRAATVVSVARRVQVFSALDWAATEVNVTLKEVAAGGRLESPAVRRRAVVLFYLATTCVDLLAFFFSECSSVFLTGPPRLAARLAEMLAFLVVHAPVDPAAPAYRALLVRTATLAPPHMSHTPTLLPLLCDRTPCS